MRPIERFLLRGVMATVCLAVLSHSVPAQTAEAKLVNSIGDTIGTVTFWQVKNGVRIDVYANSLPPGNHGFHIHNTGACTTPDFKSAGDHFNPFDKLHGFDNPQGPHAGDLPNLLAGKDGVAEMTMVDTLVTLKKGKRNSLLKPGGTSIVIHQNPDDYKSQPSGNSGQKIACGVIRPLK